MRLLTQPYSAPRTIFGDENAAARGETTKKGVCQSGEERDENATKYKQNALKEEHNGHTFLFVFVKYLFICPVY